MDRRGSRYRLVERYVVHDGCAPLAERVANVVPADAEYVVLDLDRTIHLAITIGERLGWEIIANPIAVAGETDELRPIFSVRAPLSSLGSLMRATRYWGLAGLLYAMTVRLGDYWLAWHRSLMVTLGPAY